MHVSATETVSVLDRPRRDVEVLSCRPQGRRCYDAFLSYNSQDRPAVEELARRLRAEGLDALPGGVGAGPGQGVPAGAGRGALRQSKTCVVFLGPSGLGPWQKQELQVAIDKRVRDRDFHVIPVLLPGAERPRRGDVAHLEFLINASWVEFLKTLDDEKAFRRLVWGITGEQAARRRSSRGTRGSARIAAWRRSGPTTRRSSSAART